MKPPNTLYGPGSMVGVKSRGDYIEIYGICGVRGSLGPGFAPVAGPTQREELSHAAKKRFKIGAELLGQLQLEAQFEHIRSITVAFENPRIMALRVEDVISNMAYRSQACKDAIAIEMSRPGTEVTMVTSTLEGDLIYSIGWSIDYNIDAQATVPAMVELAARLGVGQAHITSRSISSKALIWGINDDLFLAQISIKGETPATRLLRRVSTRLIPPSVNVDLTADPIAPIVPSTNPENEHYRSSTMVPTREQ